VVSRTFLRVKKGGPQGLKPAFLADLGGTAEAVPEPKAVLETSSHHRGAEKKTVPRAEVRLQR
jgi:hypothetical protein